MLQPDHLCSRAASVGDRGGEALVLVNLLPNRLTL